MEDTTDRAPQVLFLSPTDGDIIRDQVTVIGGADDDHRVVALKVRVDSGAWKTMPGSKVWYYDLDTTELQDGRHVISAMAFR